MDTSKEYIKMCEKAKEIQKIFYNDREFDPMDFMEWIKKPTGKVVIWLPRQDQLQEMVFDKAALGNPGLLARFIFWLGERKNKPIDVSMEQLWLAFVMKERYSKEWDGQEWKILSPIGK